MDEEFYIELSKVFQLLSVEDTYAEQVNLSPPTPKKGTKERKKKMWGQNTLVCIVHAKYLLITKARKHKKVDKNLKHEIVFPISVPHP